jgi:anthranilate synthase component II
MILLIDNYDSFTYNLYDYVAQCGVDCTVMRNDARELQDIINQQPPRQSWQGVILSPGPKTPHEAGLLMPALDFFVRQGTPLLGICLGHQAIGEYFGGRLVRAQAPMHGKTSLLEHSENGLFKNIAQHTEVMRYHSLRIEVGDDFPLLITARSTDDDCIMAFKHPSLPIDSLQFHPESILSTDGLAMIRNWVDFKSLSFGEI